jgi:hypothetical protein
LDSISKEQLLKRLDQLTKNMDIPAFRKGSPKWLSRNIGIRNGTHRNFPEALEIAKELVKRGC